MFVFRVKCSRSVNHFVAQEKRLHEQENSFWSANKETTVSKFQNDKIWNDFMAAALHKPYLFAKLHILKSKIKEKNSTFLAINIFNGKSTEANSIPLHKINRQEKNLDLHEYKK